MDKPRSDRQQAVLNYVYDFTLENDGRPPTLNDMIRNKVGEHTSAGAITSKSVLRYNLQRLEERGDLYRVQDGSSRNLTVPGSLYTIPFNILQDTPWQSYEIILLDIDDFIDGQFPDLGLAWVRQMFTDDDKIIFTISTLHKDCDVWKRIGVDGFLHIYKERPFQVVNEIIHHGYDPDTVAVISEQHGMRLAALGFGLGVFQHGHVHGLEPIAQKYEMFQVDIDKFLMRNV